MNRNLIEKWESLLKGLTTSQKSNFLCSSEEIDSVEKQLGFKFPISYKEFCLLFGSGSLGIGEMPDVFRIYCPCCPLQTEFDIRETGYSLIGLKLDLESYDLDENDEKAKIAYRLLENGYAFGNTSGGDSFFWDLTTYRDDDQSYDIYLRKDEDIEGITAVERDFFEFVDKFCLGNGLHIMYPKEFDSETYQCHDRFFTAFEQYEEEIDAHTLFINHLFEDAWRNLSNNELFTEKRKVKLSCMYDAADKEKAECLQKYWSKEAEVKITEPSSRANIPRLVEISVTKEGVNQEFVEELLKKMIQIGEECNCSFSGFGTELNPEY